MLTIGLNPFRVLETERLILRRTETADLEALYDIRSNDEVLRYLDRDKQTREDVMALIERIQDDQEKNTGINWMIALKDKPGDAIGAICYWKIEPENYRGEIGYMLHPNHWRKGILSEAMNAVINYGFDIMNLHSIEANVNPHNEASITLLEKFGFKKEAHFTENWYYNGKFLDSAIYCKVKGK